MGGSPLLILWFLGAALLGVVLDARTHGQPVVIPNVYCAAGHECTTTRQDRGWPIVTNHIYTFVDRTTGYTKTHYNNPDFELTIPPKTTATQPSRMPGPNVLFVLLASAIPVILLKMRATWLLHKEYIKVWKREMQRKPIGKLKTKTGRTMSRQEAFARLNVATIKTNGITADLPPSIKLSFSLQITALSIISTFMYLLVQWSKP